MCYKKRVTRVILHSARFGPGIYTSPDLNKSQFYAYQDDRGRFQVVQLKICINRSHHAFYLH